MALSAKIKVQGNVLLMFTAAAAQRLDERVRTTEIFVYAFKE